MFLFCRSNHYVNEKISVYEKFLDCIDNLSAIRLRGIDMSFELFKEKLKQFDFDLTETTCYGPTIDINRNQLGFYVDESRALFSDTEFNNYQYGVRIYKKFKDDFERIHQLLLEKEIIMNGYYKIKKGNEAKIKEMVDFLGYGEKREQVIKEDKPEHPSREYKKIEAILDKTRQNDVNYDDIVEQVLNMIQPYFLDKYEVRAKIESDKYDRSFDDSFGVMVLDKNQGEPFMLYEVDGFDVKRDEYSKYLKKDCKYLEIYFRIIAKCIKEKYNLSGPEIGRKML